MAKKKLVLLILSAALLLSVAVGGTVAYLTARSNEVANSFTPPLLSHELVQSESGSVRTDVAVKNTGNTAFYVRAFVTVNFVSESGEVLAAAPAPGVDYAITLGSAGWAFGSDGCCYCTEPIAAETTSSALIARFEDLGTAPEGYTLELRVLTSVIQASPASAVTESWGVTLTGTTLTPP